MWLKPHFFCDSRLPWCSAAV